MNLHLVLTGHWFDETVSGRKRIEYRALKPIWLKRIWLRRAAIQTVTFSRGYTSTKSIAYRVTKIDMGPCPIPGWEGAYFRIHFTAQ